MDNNENYQRAIREIEERMNSAARSGVVSAIDNALGRSQHAPMESRMTRLEVEFEHVRRDLDEIRTDLKALPGLIDARYRSLLWTLVPVIVATGLAMAGLVYQGQANLLSAFQTGLTALQAASDKPTAPPVIINVPPAPPPAAKPD